VKHKTTRVPRYAIQALLLLPFLNIAALAQNAGVVKHAAAKLEPVQFHDVSRQLGIHWKHTNGATRDKYMIESMGGGGAFLDYDRDGRLDIFLVDSGCHKFSRPSCHSQGNALYHQNADGTFTDVTKEAGLASKGYGIGVTVGDYDNDGFPDIFITNFGKNQLFHNNRDGTFTDVTEKAGVAGDGGWSSSAVFFDYNHDGAPDLFVGKYVDWNYDKNIYCGLKQPGYRDYCGPEKFASTSSHLYRNNGDGTFTDVTQQAGLALQGKALGVVAFDCDRDGWLDLYVTNDSMRNFLFHNNHDGTFSEIAERAGVAYGQGGKALHGMGVDAADLDADGFPELFTVNLDAEPEQLFHNNGDGTFDDIASRSHLNSAGLFFSGFGAKFLDYDNDGWMDLFVANGHPSDKIHLYKEQVTTAERPFLLANRAGAFEDVGRASGTALARRYNGRGLAVGDFDNDGDPDVLLIQNGGAPALLRNDGGNRNRWIGFKLIGHASSRDAVGAVVTVTAGGVRQIRELVGGGSYLSAHDQRLLFGLGKLEQVETVEIRWPAGGRTVLHNLAARKYYSLEEPITK
jgi:hypothetical protein